MVWALAVAVVALPLVALAVALLRAYRAGRALAAEVGRASAALEPLTGAGGTAPPLTEDELRRREAALLAREADLDRRLRTAPS